MTVFITRYRVDMIIIGIKNIVVETWLIHFPEVDNSLLYPYE